MPPCGTGQTLAAVQNGDSAKLEDVLVGEVWLASGQSNMLFRLNQTTTAKEDIAASGDDQLRLLNNIPQAHTNNAPYSGKDFDAVTTDNVILLGYIADDEDAFKLAGENFTKEPYGIGVKKDDAEFRDFINDILEEAFTDGSWQTAWDDTAGTFGAELGTPGKNSAKGWAFR